MEVGDMIILIRSPFEEENIFGYSNGDLGIIKQVICHAGVFETCLVILLKNFNEYHIPNSYMQKLEIKC